MLGALPLRLRMALLFNRDRRGFLVLRTVILVPMLMLLGYSPELTQTAYRVGDSLTNIITPLSSNFPLVLMFFQRCEPRAGIGTVTATMLPYTLTNAVLLGSLLAPMGFTGYPPPRAADGGGGAGVHRG